MRGYSTMAGLGSLESLLNQRMSPEINTHDDEEQEDFFVPTYLQSSTYMNRLESAHIAKQEDRSEPQRHKLTTTDTAYSTPTPSSLPAGSHRGIRHQVVERTPPNEDEDPLPPLPSRWDRSEMWTGLDVSSDGRDVRFAHSKAQQDRDRERERERDRDRDHEAFAIRANHYMPPQCGIYYYEVLVTSARPDE